MRKRRDIFLPDTAPVRVVPDARVAARHVDAMMFTLRWEATGKQQVRAGIDMFASVGMNVTGLILGKVDPKGP